MLAYYPLKMKIFLFKWSSAVVLGLSAVSADDSSSFPTPSGTSGSLISSPTYYPSGARDPTPKPTSPCDGNTPGWTDVDGDGCDWYEANDFPGCPLYGDFGALENREEGVANDNCCHCTGTVVSGHFQYLCVIQMCNYQTPLI